MWEYSICVKNNNNQIINFLYLSLKKQIESLGGVATLLKDENFSSVVVATSDDKRDRAQLFLTKVITKVICSYFKTEFLNKYLYIPVKDEMSAVAFKKALINFDKETDFYIVSRNLSFDKTLYLESFYNFKLQKLRDKWGELINLANENRDYLSSQDSFFDLLKFLVDNIDICEDEIDIVEDEEGYRIFSGREEGSIEGLNPQGLVCSVIDLSPQKINLYCKKENRATEILKKLYEKRVNLKFKKENQENSLTFFKIWWNHLTKNVYKAKILVFWKTS